MWKVRNSEIRVFFALGHIWLEGNISLAILNLLKNWKASALKNLAWPQGHTSLSWNSFTSVNLVVSNALEWKKTKKLSLTFNESEIRLCLSGMNMTRGFVLLKRHNYIRLHGIFEKRFRFVIKVMLCPQNTTGTIIFAWIIQRIIQRRQTRAQKKKHWWVVRFSLFWQGRNNRWMRKYRAHIGTSICLYVHSAMSLPGIECCHYFYTFLSTFRWIGLNCQATLHCSAPGV